MTSIWNCLPYVLVAGNATSVSRDIMGFSIQQFCNFISFVSPNARFCIVMCLWSFQHPIQYIPVLKILFYYLARSGMKSRQCYCQLINYWNWRLIQKVYEHLHLPGFQHKPVLKMQYMCFIHINDHLCLYHGIQDMGYTWYMVSWIQLMAGFARKEGMMGGICEFISNIRMAFFAFQLIQW